MSPKARPQSVRGMANWTLRFISGKYQGGEFPLEEREEYHVGRSSESDLVLVEDMVSRNHAKLAVLNDVVKLHDLGSTNGSFVNGERVSDVKLKEGDRVLFGTSIIKLVRSSAVDAPTMDFTPVPRTPGRGKPRSAMTTAVPVEVGSADSGETVTGSMSGMLSEVPLPDLLQLFAGSRKAGVLKLIDGDDKASLHLRAGQVVHCEIAGLDLPPMKAVFRVMSWAQGMFVLEAPVVREFSDEIEMSTEGLMMEAMRRIDEMEHARERLPNVDALVRVVRPLTASLRELSPEKLDLLQAVMNADVVADVLDHFPQSDLEIMQDLDQLISSGYVEVG